MLKLFLSFILLTLFSFQYSYSQTLFTYGNKQVNKDDFITAFNKYRSSETNRQKALNDYLQVYIDYKLKIQSAYDEKLNESPSFVFENKNFRDQLAQNIIEEESGINALKKEAFVRSQKDIHAAQVFIEIPASGDTSSAFKEIQKAYASLKTGKSFENVATEFSTDTYTKEHRGDIGFITAFTLPYTIETEIYKLKPGSFGLPFKTKSGYHIFKNVSERPALGSRKIIQILISSPVGISESIQNKNRALVDSIYSMYKQGISFEKLYKQFNTSTGINNDGTIEIHIGEYDAAFEQEVFALKNVDDVSAPFQSNFGYHLIKLTAIIPPGKSLTDPATDLRYKQKVENDKRMQDAEMKFIQTKRAALQYKPANYNKEELFLYTENATAGKNNAAIKNIQDGMSLFSFGQQQFSVEDWLRYAKQSKPGGAFSYDHLLNDFVNVSALKYYGARLEEYNKKMQQQLMEFNEANLSFAAMDKHIWTKSQEDTVKLKAFYEQHAKDYQWGPSVSLLVISCSDKELATEVAQKIKSSPDNWRSITNKYEQNVFADSGRYDVKRLPINTAIETKKGFISNPLKQSSENFYSFVYVTQVYPQQAQRTFYEAKGLVTSDYQKLLEKEWISALKTQYPVHINENVWKTIK
ncbi:peptidylprolyl isomerase [Chitinophagaceae bacterium LWZ2-11]